MLTLLTRQASVAAVADMQLPETLEGWLSLLEATMARPFNSGLDRVRRVKDG